MDKDAWVKKLSSRKFWFAVAAFVTGLIAFIKNPTGDPTSLIMSFGAVIAYIVAEGFVDAAREHGETYIIEPEEHPPEEAENE